MKRNKSFLLSFLIAIVLGLGLTAALMPVFALDSGAAAPVMCFGPDPKESMSFTWHAPVSTAIGQIEYSPIDGNGLETAPPARITARGVVTKTDADLRQVFRATATGLRPGTTYRYRILSDNAAAAPAGAFRTAGGESEACSFIHITDTQGFTTAHYDIWANTLKQAVKQFPQARFLLHTGDFVDQGHMIWQWDQWVAAARNELRNLPVVPVVGNHEAVNTDGTNPKLKNFLERFPTPEVPDTGAIPGTVYSFDYGAAHIAVMNTECGSANFSKQAEWLRRDMAASAKPWRIVALHRSPYGALNNTVDIRAAWVPVFDELKIDVVLAGHDHSYVRSPMMNGKRVKTGLGTTYIALNAGGVKFYPGRTRSWQVVNFQNYRQMFLGVSIDPYTLNIKAFDDRSLLLDEVTFRK